METNMKHYLLALSIGTAFLVGCQSPQKQNLIDSNFAFAEQQLKYAFPKIDEARANESQESKEKRIAKQWGELTNPRNTEPDGSLRLVPSKDWTSGFFPGELWYVYEYTHDPFWKEKAEKHTEMLEREKKNGTTHDMGFKMYCSYGNGYRLTGNPTYTDRISTYAHYPLQAERRLPSFLGSPCRPMGMSRYHRQHAEFGITILGFPRNE